MSGKQILALVIAIVVAVVAIRIVWAILSFLAGALWLLVSIAIGAGIVYVLYRGFNHLLTSGKRLT